MLFSECTSTKRLLYFIFHCGVFFVIHSSIETSSSCNAHSLTIWHTSTENGWKRVHTKPHQQHRINALPTIKKTRREEKKQRFLCLRCDEMRRGEVNKKHVLRLYVTTTAAAKNVCNYAAKETKQSCQILVHQTCLSTFLLGVCDFRLMLCAHTVHIISMKFSRLEISHVARMKNNWSLQPERFM